MLLFLLTALAFSAVKSQTCGAANTPRSFRASSLVALRLGNGLSALPATALAVPAFLDEIDTATGELLQTIAMPTGALVTNSSGGIASVGCTFNPVHQTSGLIALSLDKRTVSMACHPFDSGATITTTASKTLLSVAFDGTLIPSVVTSYLPASGTVPATNWNTNNLGGAVSDNNTFIYFATASGAMVAQAGVISVGQLAGTTTSAVQNVMWQPPFVYTVRSSGVAVLANAANAVRTPIGVYANTWAPSTTAVASATSGGVWFQDDVSTALS